MQPFRTSVALVAYSSTSDVAGTCITGVLGSRALVWMHVARHLEEQELGLSGRRRSGFVVEMRISSSAPN